ncbi:MAG TPA: hypothetical protein VMR62_02425 [Bryobacteraceae bacterium]|jgi:hypothetical protein|nr:hypothetical protein [Bryobacteraceae bacterium]
MKTVAAVAALTILIASGAAFGGDAEFDRIVKAIESHYGTQPQHIPFMGLANFALKVAHPEGAAGVKLAVFEGLRDLRSDEDPHAWHQRDRLMDSLASSTLHPMLRVHSRHDGEATYIFMGPSGKSTRVLIATFEHDGATVIEVKANIEKLLKSLEDPEHARFTLSGE